jgi:hypothetical protein
MSTTFFNYNKQQFNADVSLNGATTLAGATTFAANTGKVQFNADVSLNGTNTVTGATTLSGLTTFAANTGKVQFNADVSLNGTNTVTGATTLSGLTTFVANTGKVQFNADVSLNGTNTVTGKTQFTADVSLNGTNTVTGATTFAVNTGKAQFNADVSLNGTNTVTGKTQFTADVSLNGTTTQFGANSNVLMGVGSGALAIGKSTLSTITAGAKLDVSGGNIVLTNGQMNVIRTAGSSQELQVGTDANGHFLKGVGTYDLAMSTANTEKMRITSGGNVGIGTSSPTAKLHLFDSTRDVSTNLLELTSGNTAFGSGGGGIIRFTMNWSGNNANYGVSQIRAVDTYVGSSGYGSLAFDTFNYHVIRERMRITHDGNVGIGTTAPARKLQVMTSNSTHGIEHSNSDGSIRMTTFVGGALSGGYIGTTTNNPFCLMANDSGPRLVIGTDGNVGIGTTNPLYPLHVDKAKNTGGATVGTGTYFDNASSGISVTSANGFDISIRCNAVWGVQFIASSDTRIKNNIVDIDDSNALSILRQIKPKTYGYVDKFKRGDGSVIGFIAQEIKEIIPKAVSIIKEFVPSFYTLCQIATTDVSNIVLVTSPIDLSWNALHDASGNAFVDADGNACSDASGNKVFKIKLYDQSNNEITCKTTDVLDKRSFLVDITNTKLSVGEYFLYGQEVDDFHTLDKNAIFTVVTAAVQDIDRKQLLDEAKIAALEGEVSSLKSENASLQSQLSALQTQMAAVLSKLNM